jgi:MFS family permease
MGITTSMERAIPPWPEGAGLPGPISVSEETNLSQDPIPEEQQNPIRPDLTTFWQRLKTRLSPHWLTRDMRLLLAARVSMSVARALAGIIVPIYLVVIGFNALELGLLFVAVGIVSAILSSLSGVLADRIGRKPLIVVLPWFTAISALIFIFSHTVALLFLFAALGSFGRGAGAGTGTVGPYQPAEQALLADKVQARYRNNLFGLVGFASSLGALIGTGPLTALNPLLMQLGWLNTHGLATYQLSFFLIAVAAALAGLLAIPITDDTVRRHAAKRAAQAADGSGRGEKTRRQQISRPSWFILVRLWLSNSVNGLAVGFFGPFITYWFYTRYGVDAATIGLLYSLINLAALFANLGAARFAASLGLVRAILIGRLLQAILMIPMVLAPTFWLAGAVYLVRMCAQRLALPLRQSYVMGVVPAEERGLVSALSILPSQATSSASPALAGYIFDHISLSLPFEVGALLQGINAVLFYVFFRKLRPPEERGVSPKIANAEQETPVPVSEAVSELPGSK